MDRAASSFHPPQMVSKTHAKPTHAIDMDVGGDISDVEHVTIRKWRKFRGLTQHELADAIGLSYSSISQIENGKQNFSHETLKAMAKKLSCTTIDLLTRGPKESETLWALWSRATPAQRRTILKIASSVLASDDEEPAA